MDAADRPRRRRIEQLRISDHAVDQCVARFGDYPRGAIVRELWEVARPHIPPYPAQRRIQAAIFGRRATVVLGWHLGYHQAEVITEWEERHGAAAVGEEIV